MEIEIYSSLIKDSTKLTKQGFGIVGFERFLDTENLVTPKNKKDIQNLIERVKYIDLSTKIRELAALKGNKLVIVGSKPLKDSWLYQKHITIDVLSFTIDLNYYCPRHLLIVSMFGHIRWFKQEYKGVKIIGEIILPKPKKEEKTKERKKRK